MSFYAVVAPREDGDADCLAAFDVDIHASMTKTALDLAKDYLKWGEAPYDAEIILIENVTSVIEEQYWNECVLGKDENAKATWNYSLDVTCPRCFEDVDIAECDSVKDLVMQEAQGISVKCPYCEREFIADLTV